MVGFILNTKTKKSSVLKLLSKIVGGGRHWTCVVKDHK